MTSQQTHARPTRGERHDALAAFVGRWRAQGKAYSVPDTPSDDPRSLAAAWTSTHVARWHTGKFFLIQDERAMTGSEPLDTLSVLGMDGFGLTQALPSARASNSAPMAERRRSPGNGVQRIGGCRCATGRRSVRTSAFPAPCL